MTEAKRRGSVVEGLLVRACHHSKRHFCPHGHSGTLLAILHGSFNQVSYAQGVPLQDPDLPADSIWIGFGRFLDCI